MAVVGRQKSYWYLDAQAEMLEESSNPVDRRWEHDHAATLSTPSPASLSGVWSGRSISLPFSNRAPARTSATKCGPLTARQWPSAACSSLNTIASPVSLVPGPLVTRVLALTGANELSMGLVVRRWTQCSAG